MATMKIVSVLVFILYLVEAAPTTCPQIEDLKPCTCTRVAYGLQILCSNFNKVEVLERAFSILREYEVHTVLLRNVVIKETIPSRIFDGLKIIEMRVENSQLSFDQPAFSGLESSLHVLNVVQKSTIKSNNSFDLAKLTKLNQLNIQRTHMLKVDDLMLNNKVPNVNTIILDYNEIHTIQNHAFATLPYLKKISLADNRIKEIKRSMFPVPANHLIRIDLSYNDIAILPEDIFSEMPSLREVILTGNLLTSLPEKTWSPVWEQLRQVYLIENKIVCDEKVYWIKELKQPNELKGNCVQPETMSGRGIEDIYNGKT